MDFEELTFLENINFIKIKHNDKSLLINTPLLRVPFGIKSFYYKGKESYNLQLSINKLFDDKSDKLLTFYKDLEIYVKNKFKDKTFLKDKTFITRIYENKNSPLLLIDLKKDTSFLCNNNFVNFKSYIDKSFYVNVLF